MGTLQTENEKVLEMNDSGCTHDDTSPSKKMTDAMATENGTRRHVNLMDLSDDVLLYILRHCSPMDLKALGYTCARLGALVLDRSLWQQVEVNDSVGRERFSWLLEHALHSGTESLKVQGFAKLSLGCLGHVNLTRKEVARNEQWAKGMQEREREFENSDEAGPSTGNAPERPPRPKSVESSLSTTQRLQNQLQLSIQQLPRLSGSPLWPDDVGHRPGAESASPTEVPSVPPPEGSPAAHSAGMCPGPLFTVTTALLKQLRTQCPNLTSLALEYCNINCKTTSPTLFPPTLVRLSLRGTKCYNLPLDKSFLFKVQDCLPDLEYLDVSGCDWFEPASLMPISKMPKLLELRAAYCIKLTEFVAYASIACRYGFRKLELIDLRGSPVGDSEVSALGWLPELRELRLAAAPRRAPAPGPGARSRTHTHYRCEPLPHYDELAPWELQEPEYYKRHNVDWRDLFLQALKEEDGTPVKIFDDVTVRYFGQTEAESTSEESERSKQHNGNSHDDQSAGSSGQSTKRRHDENKNGKEEPNCKKKKTKMPEDKSEKTSSDSDSDDDGQSKSVSGNRVSRGTGTSPMPVKRRYEFYNPYSTSTLHSIYNRIHQNLSRGIADGNDNEQNGVGHNNELQENNEQGVDDEQRRENRVRMPPDAVVISRRISDVHPRHQVLYVNVGQQLHAVYRLSIENERSICEPLRRGHALNASPSNLQNLIFCAPNITIPDIDPRSLVTDSSIRRFGQADNDNISYVNIGPHGPFQREPEGRRANRSNLRVLSVRGFRYITNASLMHLATAAPHLRLVDFSDTMVTPQGVEYFMSLRPDVEVRYSKFDDSETSENDQQTETSYEIDMLDSP